MTGEQPSAERVYTLEGFAVPEQIGAVHDLLAQAAHDHPELDPTDVMLFETAVIEIANNVVEYGQPEGEVRWRFTIQVRPEEIEPTWTTPASPSSRPAARGCPTSRPRVAADSRSPRPSWTRSSSPAPATPTTGG